MQGAIITTLAGQAALEPSDPRALVCWLVLITHFPQVSTRGNFQDQGLLYQES